MEDRQNTQYEPIDRHQLWRERILGQYLRGEISREDAVQAVGIDGVDLAECQHKAMLKDLSWAMGHSAHSAGGRNEA